MLQQPQYPLHITFKIWTLAPNKISVVDDSGKLLFLMRQKAFRLKEVIAIYGDESMTAPLYEIKADRIIDFSARYNFTDSHGNELGGLKRQGMKSLWKARYDLFDPTSSVPIMTIQEENPWVKVADALFSEIPLVGMFTGYFFNPSYTVTRPDGAIVMRLSKIPGFLSRHFTIQQVDRLTDRQELQAILSVLMMILLERNRG
jgi:hypothetical protein